MSKVTISPPNAILFVLDPTNKDVVVPPYVDGELIAATETCVSVGTQAPVDGETDVSFDVGDITHSALQRVFVGRIAVPGGKIAIVTAELQRVLGFDVPKGKIGISIWVDDLRHPAQIAVNMG